MKIKVKVNRNFICTILLAVCCIYYCTYKFWDVLATVFKFFVLALVILGVIGYFLNLMKKKKLGFGSSAYFILFLFLEIIFFIYAIAAKNNSQRLLALYQYNFYTLILLSCIFYTRRANANTIFNLLRILGCLLALLSIYEVVAKVYLVPVDEWYGRINYDSIWFLRAKVFSGSPMVYGLIMAVLSLIAFDFYQKKRKAINLFIFILNLVGLFTSFSRGPYVSFAGAIILYLFLDEKINRKKLIKYIGGGIAFVIIFVLIIEIGSKSNLTLALLKTRLFSIFEWSESSASSSNASRLLIWIESIKTIFDGHNWLTGIGAAATGAKTLSTGGFVTESGLLRRYVEFGIPIATFYYFFLIGLIRKGYLYSKRNKNKHLILETAVIVCILIEDTTLQITEEISITFFLWLFIAFLLTFHYKSGLCQEDRLKYQATFYKGGMRR